MSTSWNRSQTGRRAVSWFLSLAVLSLLIACGGDSATVKPLGQYEAGSKTQADLEDLLKADSRVQDYDISGDNVTVNVNQSFTSAPYGMQQRTLWKWYNTWQAAKSGSKTATVTVKSNGADIAHWNNNDGYKPAAEAKAKTE